MKKVFVSKTSNRGKRLDSYLTEMLSGKFSRSQVKRLINEGKVLIDGRPKKPHYGLVGEHRIEILLPDADGSRIAAEDIPLEVVYEDEDILVVNKSAGMVVHPAAGNPRHTLVNAALFHTDGKLSHKETSSRPGIVHRLDKEVSGLIVIAKTDSAHSALVEGFQNRTIKRKYIAFVKGKVSQDEGRIALPIGRAARDRKKMAVRFFHSKDAMTDYKVLKRFPNYTKLALELETGRTHQIRVHMSYMGHPIIGDCRYGGGRFKRIALYAAEIHLKHPRRERELHFVVEMPDALKELERAAGVFPR